MSDKLPLNKNTLTSLKADLRDYHAALPVFEMKVQQLKKEVGRAERKIRLIREEFQRHREEAKKWVAVMADLPEGGLPGLDIIRVESEKEEVAGVTLMHLSEVVYADCEDNSEDTPLWTDAVTTHLRKQTARMAEIRMEKRNIESLTAELAEARRMENALKEIFIPQAVEHIRKIEAYLGDVERLAIASAKLMKKIKDRQNQPL